jgi:hypothetical protein
MLLTVLASCFIEIENKRELKKNMINKDFNIINVKTCNQNIKRKSKEHKYFGYEVETLYTKEKNHSKIAKPKQSTIQKKKKKKKKKEKRELVTRQLSLHNPIQ